MVGVEEDKYSKIVDSFRNDKIGSFARVIVVNSLHVKLPRLVLSVSYTCNCFDASWVKKQWEKIHSL